MPASGLLQPVALYRSGGCSLTDIQLMPKKLPQLANTHRYCFFLNVP